MTFGEKISVLRKQQKWSQDSLAKKIGTSAPIVGRYERNEIKPSIEVAAKIADALEVTVDYLIGRTKNLSIDKKTLERLEEIASFNDKEKETVLFTLDAVIREIKNRKVYG